MRVHFHTKLSGLSINLAEWYWIHLASFSRTRRCILRKWSQRRRRGDGRRWLRPGHRRMGQLFKLWNNRNNCIIPADPSCPGEIIELNFKVSCTMQRVPPFASRRASCRGTSYIGYTSSLVGICHLIYHLHNNTYLLTYAARVYRYTRHLHSSRRVENVVRYNIRQNGNNHLRDIANEGVCGNTEKLRDT